jgi:hypothetical protein
MDTDCDNDVLGIHVYTWFVGTDSWEEYYTTYDMLKRILKNHTDAASSSTTAEIVDTDELDEFYANWVENGYDNASGLSERGDDADEYMYDMMRYLVFDDDRYDELHDDDYGLLNIRDTADVDTDNTVFWVNMVNEMWIANRFSYTTSLEWINALNPVLATNDGTTVLATDDLNTFDNGYSNKFWVEKWHVDDSDFDADYPNE